MSELLINDEYSFPEHLLSVIIEFLLGPETLVASRVSKRWYRASCIPVRYHYLIHRFIDNYSKPGQTLTAKILCDLLLDPFQPLSFITAHIHGASKRLLGDTMLFIGKLCCTAAQGKDSEFNRDNFLIRGLEESKVIKLTAKHLHSTDDDILEQAAWCVSNLSFFAQGKEAFMNEPKAFPRLCSLLDREPMPKHSIMRVVVWSLSNLLNDERIQDEFFLHKDWIEAFLNISSKVPRTSEIRLQAFRGLWNLAGRNNKHRKYNNIAILHQSKAMRVLDLINFDNERQNLTLCIYAIGFVTEIIRFFPEEVAVLIGKQDILTLFLSLAGQVSLKNQFHSYHLLWEVVYGLALGCQNDIICKKINTKKCLELLHSLPKFKKFKKINLNFSYVTARLSIFHPTCPEWETIKSYLVETARSYGTKSGVVRRNLAWTLKNIDQTLAENTFGPEILIELTDSTADISYFAASYDRLSSCKDFIKKLLGGNANLVTQVKEIALFGINYLLDIEEVQKMPLQTQQDILNMVMVDVVSSLTSQSDLRVDAILQRFKSSLKSFTDFS